MKRKREPNNNKDGRKRLKEEEYKWSRQNKITKMTYQMLLRLLSQLTSLPKITKELNLKSLR